MNDTCSISPGGGNLPALVDLNLKMNNSYTAFAAQDLMSSMELKAFFKRDSNPPQLEPNVIAFCISLYPKEPNSFNAAKQRKQVKTNPSLGYSSALKWFSSFHIATWVLSPPSHQLDRIDNAGHYEPGNEDDPQRAKHRLRSRS